MPDPRIHACRKYERFTIISCIPDYCYTTVGPSIVVLPYNLVAEGMFLDGVSVDVSFASDQAAKADSLIPWCTGDEKGDVGGVISGTRMGVCEFLQLKADVLVNGKPAVGQTMLSWMNNRNTLGINKDASPHLGLAGDALSIASEALKELASIINKNLDEARKSLGNFDLDDFWLSRANTLRTLGRLTGVAGEAASIGEIITAPDRTAETMKYLMEKLAVASLTVIGGLGVLPATLVVIASKHALETTADLEQERRDRLVECVGNNPANGPICSRAYGYPAVDYPIPRNFGF